MLCILLVVDGGLFENKKEKQIFVVEHNTQTQSLRQCKHGEPVASMTVAALA